MAQYDSDSSEDANTYTTTNVILGYASNESSGDEVSHIGGHPTWLDEKFRPQASLVKCKNCKGLMSLLLQLNADLQQHFPNDTRRIYIWSCRNKACSRRPGSIRAFREVKKAIVRQEIEARKTTTAHSNPSTGQGPGLGSLLFGGTGPELNNNSNPFSTTSAESSKQENLVNPFGTADKITESNNFEPISQTFAEKLKIGTTNNSNHQEQTKDEWPEDSAFPKPYPFLYLDAYPEELDPTPTPKAESASSSRTQYDVDDAAVGGAGAEKDNFESTLDKTFQKFSDLVAQNPEQVLRYEFKGQPVLYSGSDGVSTCFVVPHGKAGAAKGIPRCESCGAHRVFEMQLTPYLIFEVEKDETLDIEDGMEWGTILVGVCANNCGDTNGSVAFREEWAGTQWEERVARK